MDDFQRTLTRRIMRLAWIAGRPCAECGSPDYVSPTWKVQPGPVLVGSLWEMSEENRQRYLPDLTVLCRSCIRRRANASRRNGHGEGSTGVPTCHERCCLDARLRYYYSRQRRSEQ